MPPTRSRGAAGGARLESGRDGQPPWDALSSTSIPVVAEVLAALAYGEKLGAARAEAAVGLAPDARSRREQQHVAARERENQHLVHARLAEIGEERLMERFQPYFDAFFEHTEPADWIEAQTFHYVG